jgi:hypothetical protein
VRLAISHLCLLCHTYRVKETRSSGPIIALCSIQKQNAWEHKTSQGVSEQEALLNNRIKDQLNHPLSPWLNSHKTAAAISILKGSQYSDGDLYVPSYVKSDHLWNFHFPWKCCYLHLSMFPSEASSQQGLPCTLISIIRSMYKLNFWISSETSMERFPLSFLLSQAN